MRAKLMLGMIAAALGLSGCEKPPKDKLVTIEGQEYLIPWQHTPVVNDPRDLPYARSHIENAVETFTIMILYRESSYELNSKYGYPSLFGVVGETREEMEFQLLKMKSNDDDVFCEKKSLNSGLAFQCGLRVQDDKVSWSVNFDTAAVPFAAEIRKKAEKIIKGYREAANAQRK
jgi:hypothetical protein